MMDRVLLSPALEVQSGDMIFNIGYIVPAVLLLLLPLPLVFGKTKDYRTRGYAPNPTLRGAFRAWQNWLDLVRAAGGVSLLLNDSIIIESSDANSVWLAFCIKAGVLAIGVMLQTFHFGSELNIFAPVFYLSGITLVLPAITGGWDFTASGFAVLFAWTMAWGTRDIRYLVPSLGIALGISGVFLRGFDAWLAVNLGLVFSSLLFATLFQKRLMFVGNDSRGSTPTITKAPVPAVPQ